LWNAALAQVLAGPGWLDHDLRTGRGRAQAVLDAAPARTMLTDSEATTVAMQQRPGRLTVALRGVRAVTGLVRKPSARSAARVAPAEFTWQVGLGRDVVVLDGSGSSLVRDPGRARRELLHTICLHAQAFRRWGGLRQAYARALPAGSTAERWRATIGSP
jgi:galactofuranosylgalactofuranosylrhamnosyl-N-acetylglucosaminyl-diphospho-decaprenol beta-1,5/1,6-galactofuranosyltransferase